MSYDDAVKVLEAKGSEIGWGGDFGGADETLLSEGFESPLMVDRYPTQIKAFYMQPDPARPEVAMGVDVLAPEGYGEIIGGGQRIHDPELLLERIREHGLPQGSLRLVHRPAQVRHGAARRLRHGYRAVRSVDLRPGARAGDDCVPAHAVQAAAVRGIGPPMNTDKRGFNTGLLSAFIRVHPRLKSVSARSTHAPL